MKRSGSGDDDAKGQEIVVDLFACRAILCTEQRASTDENDVALLSKAKVAQVVARASSNAPNEVGAPAPSGLSLPLLLAYT